MNNKFDFSEVKSRTHHNPDGSKTHWVTEVYRRGDFPLEEQAILHRDDQPAYLRYKIHESVDGENRMELLEERWYTEGKVDGTDTQPAWSKWNEKGQLTFQSFYKEGVLHRGNNKPAHFSLNNETGEYDVQFWIDGAETEEPELLDSEL